MTHLSTSRSPVRDQLRRPLGSLRVSVTDRCNLRCRYCMPEEEYVWLPRESILSFEEIERLIGVFTSLGVSKVRITGGEPLLRQDLGDLLQLIKRNVDLRDLAMTTNGMLLARHVDALCRAGLDRITISLDTLRPDRFAQFARSARHSDVLAGIDAVQEAGFPGTKLNCVVIKGFNDDELPDLLAFGVEHRLEVRFIEYMDVGGATRWTMDDVVTRSDMLRSIRRAFGEVMPVVNHPTSVAPADRYQLPDGTTFGIIASTTGPFCQSCDRSRLTADGMWLLCLYAESGVDLKNQLRAGASDQELRSLLAGVWEARQDRGAEERLRTAGRGPLYELEGLRADPHREMHTRGG